MTALSDVTLDGPLPGAVNMARDEEAALGLLAGRRAPGLRFYSWRPWAVSLGHHQDAADVDHARCAADGIDVVRRPTGGRAILHAEELTYAVVLEAEGTILEMYRRIAGALLAGLREFGVEAELERSQPDFAREYREASGVSCFSSAARHEILWRGRKLAGSAQRRYRQAGREVVLQHGSILTGPAHMRLTDYLAAPEEARRSLRRSLERKTADLASITGGAVDRAALAACLRRGFEEEFGLAASSLTGTGRPHAADTSAAR